MAKKAVKNRNKLRKPKDQPWSNRPQPRKRAATEPKARARVEKLDRTHDTAMAVAHAGLDKKAEDVTLLDVRGLASYADYFVVMTADSERQASAIADHIDDALSDAGRTKVGIEGQTTGRWILLDYGDVVAHIFSRDARDFYDLEGLWADAKRTAVAS